MFVTQGFAAPETPAAGELQTETGAHAAPGAREPFAPFETQYFPSQLLWLAITFGLFYIFLQRVVLPRIGGILEVRRDRIANDLDAAARMKEDADAAVAAYEQELTEARAKSNRIANEARDAAKAEAEVERKQIEGDLNKRLAEAETRIAAVRDSAMKDVGAIAEETAAAIVQALSGKSDKAAVAAAVKSLRG